MLYAVAASILSLPMVSMAGADEVPVAARVHREAIVVDGHNDVTTWILDSGFDLGMDAERQLGDGVGMIAPRSRDSRGHHVLVPYRLDLLQL